MSQPDPITLAVVEGALDSCVREMTITMRRASMSPVLAIGNDFSNAIFDGNARMVLQGQDQPVHLGAMVTACKEVAKRFLNDIRPGDVIYHNDPASGGSHLPDMTLYKPVFWGDELVFWTANRSHMNETGGPVPGGYNPLAEDIWAEGVRIPPVKLYEQGAPRTDLIELLATNFRTPRQFYGDLGAQLAACTLAERRLVALVERYGLDVIQACLDALLDRAERLMRAEITRLPSGEYSGMAIVESPSPGQSDPEIHCVVSIEHDTMRIRVSGSPMVRWHINSYRANTLSAIYWAVLTFTRPDLPHNEGLYRPIELDLGAPGSIVNAVVPGACGLSTGTPFDNIADAVRSALAHAMPKGAGGAWARACTNALSGIEPRTGEAYSYYMHSTGWGGGGAFWGFDGEPCVGPLNAAGAAMTGDVEAIEQALPIQIHRYELRPNSACPGRWRGGLGCHLEFSVTGHQATLTQFGDGMKYPPTSVLGGGSELDAERVHRKHILRANGEVESIPLYCVKTIQPEDIVVIDLAGGGAVGSPRDREPASVARDVISGLVSIERAESEYYVHIDPQTLEVDLVATQNLRAGHTAHFENVHGQP